MSTEHIVPFMAKCGRGFGGDGYNPLDGRGFIIETIYLLGHCEAKDCEARKAMREKAKQEGFIFNESAGTGKI